MLSKSKSEQYHEVLKLRGTKTISGLKVKVKPNVEVDMTGVGANVHNYNEVLKVYNDEIYVLSPNMLYKDGQMYQDVQWDIIKNVDLKIVGYDSNLNVEVEDKDGVRATYSLIEPIPALSNADKLSNGCYVSLFLDEREGSVAPNDIDVVYDTLINCFDIVGVID